MPDADAGHDYASPIIARSSLTDFHGLPLGAWQLPGCCSYSEERLLGFEPVPGTEGGLAWRSSEKVVLVEPHRFPTLPGHDKRSQAPAVSQLHLASVVWTACQGDQRAGGVPATTCWGNPWSHADHGPALHAMGPARWNDGQRAARRGASFPDAGSAQLKLRQAVASTACHDKRGVWTACHVSGVPSGDVPRSGVVPTVPASA